MGYLNIKVGVAPVYQAFKKKSGAMNNIGFVLFLNGLYHQNTINFICC